MKVKTVKNNEERTILTAMIVETSVLGRISAKWTRQGLFRSEWSNLVGSWCVHFYRKFDKAPQKAIQGLYHRWAEKSPNKETVAMVEKFLTSLSSDYKALKKDINPEFTIDIASRFFNRVRLEKLQASIESDLELGEVDKATKMVEDFHTIEMGMGSTVEVLTDKEALRSAFDEAIEGLIEYPGALGRFMSNHFQRDSFIAFLGPEKRGKSFWLLDVAWRALEQRRKVAYFVLGDMSQSQVQMRLGTRAAKIPVNSRFSIPFPVNIKPPKTRQGSARVGFESRIYKNSLSWQRAWKAYQDVLTNKVRSKQSYLRLCVYPPGGISVSGIDEQIKIWSQDGWVPDIIVLDYADNLDMPEGGDDPRNQNNAAWKRMRKLSQDWHACVVTATQANAASVDSYVITRRNFSEDKRKLAHVTGMIGLNQTADEKALGVYRLNWVLRREGDYSESKCVHVAGCLALANPALLSTF